MENSLSLIIGSNGSKHLPPIKRGLKIPIYLTSSGQLIVAFL